VPLGWNWCIWMPIPPLLMIIWGAFPPEPGLPCIVLSCELPGLRVFICDEWIDELWLVRPPVPL